MNASKMFALLLMCLHSSMCVHIFHTTPDTSAGPGERVYDVRWFNQTLDHFTFTTSAKFKQKYLVNDTYWDK